MFLLLDGVAWKEFCGSFDDRLDKMRADDNEVSLDLAEKRREEYLADNLKD